MGAVGRLVCPPVFKTVMSLKSSGGFDSHLLPPLSRSDLTAGADFFPEVQTLKHLIIGTAGHIDHGKTALTKALTGTDTDRLAEEKERGITIVLGFARMELPGGITASIVDVPGHERFVRNMLSGATGMDIVLLTVAADEGFMPQTWEHLDILQLLGIRKGIVVLTKCDLVNDDRLAEVTNACRKNVQGTFLEDAPILPVSSRTGAGITALREAIAASAAESASRHVDRAFRLPVDRLFPVSGFGNVVTGTLAEGSVKIGDEVMIYPGGGRAKVRELQNHDTHVGRAVAGMRTAVSLTGEDRDTLSSGCILAKPGSMQLSKQVDAYLTMAADASHELRNNAPMHFFSGTNELTCKVKLLDTDVLTAGSSGYAQLKFDQPIAARNYDRFILRFFSPVITIGGGMILDLEASRHRRNDPAVLSRLAELASDDPVDRIRQRLRDTSINALNVKEIALLENLGGDEAYQILHRLEQDGTAVLLQQGYLLRNSLDILWQEIYQQLQTYHAENPLEPGMRLAQLRERCFPEHCRFTGAILSWFSGQKLLRMEDGYAALSDFRPVYDPRRAALRSRVLAFYAKAGFTPPDNKTAAAAFHEDRRIYEQVTADMRRDGLLLVLSPTCCIHHSACEMALDIFRSLFAEKEEVTLADFRTAAEISRKYAQLLLEYWDSQGVCRRVGDGRVLCGDPVSIHTLPASAHST